MSEFKRVKTQGKPYGIHGKSFYQNGSEYGLINKELVRGWTGVSTLAEAYKLLQPRKNLMLVNPSDPCSGLSSVLVVDKDSLTMYVPNNPGKHGVSYLIVREKNEYKIGTDLSVLNTPTRIWLNGHLIYEPKVFSSVFENQPSQSLPENDNRAYEWWRALTDDEDTTSTEAEEFAEYLNTTQTQIRAQSMSWERLLLLIYSFLKKREDDEAERLTKIKNDFERELSGLINQHKFIEAAKKLRMEGLAAKLKEVEIIVGEWEPKKIVDAKEYIEKLYDKISLVNSLFDKATTSIETPQELEEIDRERAGVYSVEIITKWFASIKESTCFKDFNRLDSMHIKPTLTLAELKKYTPANLAAAEAARIKNSKNIKLATSVNQIEIDISFEKIKEKLDAYTTVELFTRDRLEAINSAEEDEWIHVAVQPFDDFYQGLPDKRRADAIQTFCTDVLQITDNELSTPIGKIVEARLKEMCPETFWDLSAEIVTNINGFVREVYKTFADIPFASAPFLVLFYQTELNVETEVTFNAPNGVWYNENEILEELEDMKNFEKPFRYKRQIQIKPMRSNVQPVDQEKINKSTKPAYNKFVAYHKDYERLESKILSERRAQGASLKELVKKLDSNIISQGINEIVGSKTEHKTIFKKFNYILKIDRQDDAMPTLSEQVIKNLTEITEFFQNNFTDFINFCKTWEVWSTSDYEGTLPHLLEQLTKSARKSIEESVGETVNKKIAEDVKKILVKIKDMEETNSTNFWRSIIFVDQNVSLIKSAMQSEDSEAVKTIEFLHNIASIPFGQQFITFMLNGISSHFAVTRESIADLQDSPPISTNSPSLAAVFAKYVVVNLGLFSSILFKSDILNAAEERDSYMRYIIYNMIKEVFPHMFIPIKFDAVKVYVAAKDVVSSRLKPATFVSQDGTVNIYNFVDELQDTSSVYKKLKPEKKIVTLEVANQLINDTAFYMRHNRVQMTLNPISSYTYLKDFQQRDLIPQPFDRLLDIYVNPAQRQTLRDFLQSLPDGALINFSAEESQAEEESEQMIESMLENLSDDLYQRPSIPRPDSTHFSLPSAPPISLIEEEEMEVGQDLGDITEDVMLVQEDETIEDFRRTVWDLVNYLKNNSVTDDAKDYQITMQLSFNKTSLVEILDVTGKLEQIRDDDPDLNFIKARVAHFQREILDQVIDSRPLEPAIAEPIVSPAPLPTPLVPSAPQPEESRPLLPPQDTNLGEEMSRAEELSRALKTLSLVEVPPEKPIRPKRRFRVEVENIKAHLQLSTRLQQITDEMRESLRVSV